MDYEDTGIAVSAAFLDQFVRFCSTRHCVSSREAKVGVVPTSLLSPFVSL